MATYRILQAIMDFKLGELFCGPGGLALGAGLARKVYKNGDTFSISHVWGVDKDEAAINTYRNNVVERYGGDAVWMDAMDFCETELLNYIRITALAFGFPCNDFSTVGQRRGFNGHYGNLYLAGIKAIEQSNPFWFIAENVSGIHSADSGDTFKRILDDLEVAGQHGYNLTVHLYKFEEYGVPQCRHRYIIVGIRKDKGLIFRVPRPTHGSEVTPFVSAEQAFENIADNAPNSVRTIQDPRVMTRLKYTPPWHNAWYLDELMEMTATERRRSLQAVSWYEEEIAHLSDNQIRQEIEYSRLNCKKARMSHIYKRLDAARPAYTITGSGGGGTHVYHWREHRALTNHERARLQSFPDWFTFEGSKEQVRKQIGMAVPPGGAKKIFEAILKTFAGINYKSIEPSYNHI